MSDDEDTPFSARVDTLPSDTAGVVVPSVHLTQADEDRYRTAITAVYHEFSRQYGSQGAAVFADLVQQAVHRVEAEAAAAIAAERAARASAEAESRRRQAGKAQSRLAKEQLSHIAGLVDDWDGYGAKRIEPELIEVVRRYLEYLPPDAFTRLDGEAGCTPAVVPGGAGTIQLEWHIGERRLELEFENRRQIRYLMWWPQEGVEDEGTYSVADPDTPLRLIKWVQSGYATA